MRITLSRLTLRNFKGVRDFTIELDASGASVFGQNATGKTTLVDGFLWLLFDKDSQNRKDFEIKTLTDEGKPIHFLNHEVEGVFLVDGRQLTLKKVYSEKWTKKRGSAQQEFTGHTTDYFINGVPAKLKEYRDRIDDLVDEDVFKLLTSPTYFNEVLDWKRRRQILLEVCGDVSDAEVIASDTALSQLPGILGDRTIEEHRKVIAARRAEINKEIEKIPVRIDEAQRSLPDTSGASEADLQSQLDQLRLQVEGKESELNRIQTGGEIAEQEKRQREIESEIIAIRNRAGAGALRAVSDQQLVVQQLKEKAADFNFRANRLDHQIKDNERIITMRESEAADLREEWSAINALEFTASVDDTCPTCGQALPEEQVQAAHTKALEHFNQHKSEKLERIVAQGKQAATDAQRLKDENERLNAEQRDLLQQLMDVQTEQQTADTKLKELQAQMTDPREDPEYVAKQAELEQVKAAIVQLRSSNLDAVQKVRRELMDLRDEVRRKETALAAFGQVATIEARIEDLKAQERVLAQEYEQLESELYLTEEFIRVKVSMLEDRINSKFRYARFKLFETQINGGLAETCQTTFQGVPYGSGLNNAARINVGLDIINTLSEHYGAQLPIWIDNRESVVNLIDVNTQVISLVVSADDKTLRIETGIKEAV